MMKLKEQEMLSQGVLSEWGQSFRTKWPLYFIVVLICFLIRVEIGLHSFSGMNSPPMFGDYEAQRHWMEITINTPPKLWYFNTTENDLQYWGLDYPPLTALHSWLLGKLASWIEPESVALLSSRGYVTVLIDYSWRLITLSIISWRATIFSLLQNTSRLFMRMTVLVTDVMFYFTGAILFCCTKSEQPLHQELFHVLIILLQPALMLIDHGHFQYNTVSLGLTLISIMLVLRDNDILGSVTFSLALNHKQMSLYHAPAFFFYLLSKKIHNALRLGHKTSIQEKAITVVYEVGKLAITVIISFIVCWAPVCLNGITAGTFWQHIISESNHIVFRLFPVARGLYEDKVANLWCAASPLLPFLKNMNQNTLVTLTMAMTLCALIPTAISLLRRPTPTQFLFGLTSSACCFFLFSYQVHEKSALLIFTPLSLLLVRWPILVPWMTVVGTFSLYPLLFKDGLSIPYFGCLFIYVCVVYMYSSSFPKKTPLGLKIVVLVSFLGLMALHILHLCITPPKKYPDLIDLVIAAYSFLHLFALYMIFTVSQLWDAYPERFQSIFERLLAQFNLHNKID